MSIKNDPEKPGAYIVRVSRRNPKTGKPNSLRRKASSLTEAKRTEKELYTALADKLHRQVVPCWNQVIREYESGITPI